jgi:hypothetical protein
LLRETGLTVFAGAVVALFCASFLPRDPGFFWTDDYQTYQLTGYCDVARAWSNGEFPLLSSSSWRGGALAAEYQYGVFSVFLTACALVVFGLNLPLPLAAAVYSIVHLAVVAGGAFRLARRRGLSADLALLVALVTSLSGWIFIWGGTSWFPALASFAWVPWFWWALEGAGKEGRWWTASVAAGIFLYLIVTAGWPFSVLVAFLLAAWSMARAWLQRRSLRSLGPTLAACLIGLGLSAPAWLMLLEFAPSTFRGQTPALQLSYTWSVPLQGLPGLVFPSYWARWPVFATWKEHVPVELTGGLVPVVILMAVLLARGWQAVRALLWEWLLVAVALLLSLAPGVGNFQYGFRWLPLFFLALGLLAAHSLALLRAAHGSVREGSATAGGRTKPANLGIVCACLFMPVWAVAILSGAGPGRLLVVAGLPVCLLSLLWAWVESSPRTARFRPWLPCAVAVGSCWVSYLTFQPFYEVPTWQFPEQIRRPPALDPAVRYFSVYTTRDIMAFGEASPGRFRGCGVGLSPGNAAMYSGLEFVTGYSPLMPSGLQDLFAFESAHGGLPAEDAARVLGAETGPGGLLELFAVDGLVVARRFEQAETTLTAHGWQCVREVEGGLVFRRTGPPSPRVRALDQAEALTDRADVRRRLTEPRQGPVPLLLLDPAGGNGHGTIPFSPARVTLLEETRDGVVVEVAATDPGHEVLLAFARPWYPGYRAECDGRPVPVELLDLTLPAVRLPPGTAGRLVLEYRPRSFVAGVCLAAATVFAVGLGFIVAGSKRVWSRPGEGHGALASTVGFVRAAADPRVVREAALVVLTGAVVLGFCAAFLLHDRSFFWADDVQTYQLAGYCDEARAWYAGELPLLSPSSWRGGALAGEYQLGVFSPFLTACVLVVFGLHLPLPLAAATLSIVHLLILAVGVLALARRQGLSPDLAMLAALVTTLSGWTFIWGATCWFPALAGFAWVPWAWWALERAAAEGGSWLRFLPAGFFLALIVTAGWPFSVLMVAVVSLWLVVRQWSEGRPWWAAWPTPAAWAVGLALSAPAWLMLAEYIPSTYRGHTPALGVTYDWAVPAHGWPALVFPSVLIPWRVFAVWKTHVPVELTGGLVPLVILATLLRARGWAGLLALRWEWLLVVGTALVAMAPGLGNFRYTFRWLPLFFLALALLAARALALLRADSAAPPVRLGGFCFALLLPAWAWALVFGSGPSGMVLSAGAALFVIALLWAWAESQTRLVWLRPWLPAAVVVASCGLSYAHFVPFYEDPIWPLGEEVRGPGPLEPGRRYLSVYAFDDIIPGGAADPGRRYQGTGAGLYPLNLPMYAGLDFVGGYSPMRPAGLQEVFDFDSFQGSLTDAAACRLLDAESGPDGLLQLYAVDGLVVASRFEGAEAVLGAHGWREVAQVEGGKVFHRDGPPSPRVRVVEGAEVLADRDEVRRRLTEGRAGPVPLILLGAADAGRNAPLSFAPARVSAVEETRNGVSVDVSAADDARETLLVLSRPWYPGYRASCAGRPVPVELLDLTLPAVRLPPGAGGRVVLEYRPRSLAWGVSVAAIAGLLIVAALVAEVIRRRLLPRDGLPSRRSPLPSRLALSSASTCTPLRKE